MRRPSIRVRRGNSNLNIIFALVPQPSRCSRNRFLNIEEHCIRDDKPVRHTAGLPSPVAPTGFSVDVDRSTRSEPLPLFRLPRPANGVGQTIYNSEISRIFGHQRPYHTCSPHVRFRSYSRAAAIVFVSSVGHASRVMIRRAPPKIKEGNAGSTNHLRSPSTLNATVPKTGYHRCL